MRMDERCERKMVRGWKGRGVSKVMTDEGLVTRNNVRGKAER